MNKWTILAACLVLTLAILALDLALHGAGPGWLDGVMQK
jgi:hypothetical protein